jgi:plastocyanin
MTDLKIDTTRCLRAMAWTLMMVLLVASAACGGGGEEEAAAPADASGEAAAPAAPATAELEPGNPAVQGMGSGSAAIAGTVTYTGQVPTLQPLSMDADPQCAAKHQGPVYPQLLELGDGNTMAHVFVKVTNPPQGDWQAPSQPAVIDQDGCRYHPHVIGMLQGQQLVFLNSDGLLHNVHGTPSANREFNLGMPASVKQASPPSTLNTPEPMFPVKCDVHPWMQSYVAVMEHPFFAVTDTDGAFEIAGLPAGEYQVEAWHEKLGTRTGSVTVEDGGTGTVDFQFDVPQS